MADDSLEAGPASKKGNRSAAPHLRTISPAYVHEVRGAGPLVQIRATAERLQSGGFGYIGDRPGERLQKQLKKTGSLGQSRRPVEHGRQAAELFGGKAES
ncbi:MAG: hypothetical protein LC633_09415, partial [Desulfobulbaceae bacterium]|nr:hypothetical protein [Desulfobulbaceae bacterium]